jgi:predicted unusual protein kinase regulating ubiquinone biosynthesis (AarF/ABC1/UbiB family)
VKVGQAVAIRPDLLPKAYLDALQELLDQVAPFSSEEARALVRAQLGGLDLEDVFEDVGAFDAPVAAASIGQVYKAKLRESAPGGRRERVRDVGRRRRGEGAAAADPRGRDARPHRDSVRVGGGGETASHTTPFAW